MKNCFVQKNCTKHVSAHTHLLLAVYWGSLVVFELNTEAPQVFSVDPECKQKLHNMLALPCCARLEWNEPSSSKSRLHWHTPPSPSAPWAHTVQPPLIFLHRPLQCENFEWCFFFRLYWLQRKWWITVEPENCVTQFPPRNTAQSRHMGKICAE